MPKKKRLVVDSSVMVKWLSVAGEQDVEQADQLLLDAQRGDVELFAPELSKYEVGNAILYKGMELPQAKASLSTLFVIPINFVMQSEKISTLSVEVAAKSGITYYDASFIALAEELGGELVSANPKHMRRFSGVKVVPLKEYK